MVHIYPSLMAANPLNYGFIIKDLEPYCAGFHMDVMDNHFVPNLTFGPSIINKFATATKRPFWVHLMVEKPATLLEKLILPPASLVTIHIGTTSEINKVLSRIREKNYLSGIAISPKNEPREIIPFLNLVDQVCVMSVEPGFSGQQFLPNAVERIDQVKKLKKELHLNFRIGIDGGISSDNIQLLIKHGVDDFAVGSAIFDSRDPVHAIIQMAKLDKHIV